MAKKYVYSCIDRANITGEYPVYYRQICKPYRLHLQERTVYSQRPYQCSCKQKVIGKYHRRLMCKNCRSNPDKNCKWALVYLYLCL